MFRMFKGAVALGAAAGAAYLAKPTIEDKYRTSKPSADLKAQSDAAKADLEKAGFTDANVEHFEGQRVSHFRAAAVKQPGMIGKVTGAVGEVRRVSQTNLFDKVEVRHESDDQSASMSVKYRR